MVHFRKRTDLMSGVLGGLIGSFKKLLAWSAQTLATSQYSQGVAYGGGRFVYLRANAGNASSSYSHSTDAITWTTAPFPSSPGVGFRTIVSNGSRIVVSGNALAYYSDNGTTWTATGTVFNSNPRDAIWDGSRFIMAYENVTTGYQHSSDGITYSSVDVGDGATSIHNNGSTYVAVITNSATARINTTNITSAAAWSSITLPAAIDWASVRWNGTVWIAVGNATATYATSTNGTTWTSRTLPTGVAQDGSAGAIVRLFVLGGKTYYATSSNATTSFLYSTVDGITWTNELSFNATVTVGSTGGATDGTKVVISLGGGSGSTTNRYLLLS